nr:MAG TPA: tail tape measure protein [Caudoviricetes sp.]
MSAKGKEQRFDIAIGGKVDKSLDKAMGTSESKLKAFKRQIRRLDYDFNKLDKGFSKIAGLSGKTFSLIGRGALTAAGAVQGIGIASTMAGSKFESAFAGVKKTVDGTKKEYQGLKKEILSLTRILPSSGAELAGTMEIAGQLGIKKSALPDFTKTMANLDVSTNMTAEEAATSFARFANITGMSDYDKKGISNYEKLGSTVVDLGNKFATTEQEIVEMGTNLSSTGKLIGLSAPEIMALGTALSSVGVEAEKGGSAMSKLFKKMQIAVETNNGMLAEFASVSGMSKSQFTEAFKGSAIGAMSKFLGGLNDTKRNGKSAIAVLNDMKLSEVRLSDTILRLANSSGNMEKAVQTANKAWEENTALTTEAGKRYETFESQIGLTKNAFSEMGIAIYDNLTRTPALGVITKLRLAINDFTDNGLYEWLDKINYKLPTFKRQIESLGEKGPLIARLGIGLGEKLLDTGKWVVNNGDYVLSVFEGIGAAMLSYKVASSSVHFINALMSLGSLSPAALGITGIATAIGGLVAISESEKAYKIRRMNEAMSKSFGKITLSMEDMEKIAKSIIGKKHFDKLAKGAEAFKKAENMARDLHNSLEDLDRRNWLAKVGVKFSEEEGEDYKNAIADYVKKAQDYVLQERYALSLSLKLTQGENSSVTRKVDNFYNSTYLEMEKLGKELSDTVNKAFSDNILDEKEIKKIARLEQKFARLQAELATSNFDAGLIKLGKKFDGTKLDSETFKNLQAELAIQAEDAENKYLEAYSKNRAGIKAAFDKGGMSKELYEKGIQKEDEAYLKNVTEIYEKIAKFQIEAIEKAKKTGLDNAYNSAIERRANPDSWTLTPESVIANMWGEVSNEYSDVLHGTRELVDNMKGTTDKLEEIKGKYKELGKEIPTAITEMMNRISSAGDIGNGRFPISYNAFEMEIGNRIANSTYADTYKDILKNVESKLPKDYNLVPKRFFDDAEQKYKTSGEEALKRANQGFSAFTEAYLRNWYSTHNFKVDANVAMRLTPEMPIWSEKPTLNMPGGSNIKVYQNAKGGIWNRPILTTFAEKGPEAAIPLDRSKRAISLWEQAGAYLGMNHRIDGVDLRNAGDATRIEYKPTLQFYGDAPSKKDLTEALSISQKEFNTLADNYVKMKRRVAF